MSEYVSFYQIAKEMAEEDNLPFAKYTDLKNEDPQKAEYEKQLRNYTDRYQKYFEDILKKQGIDPDIKYNKKSGSYHIPQQEKELLKLFLREYTSTFFKKQVRNLKGNNGKDLNSEDIEDFVKKAEVVIKETFDADVAQKQMGYLYGATEYHSKKTSEEVINNLGNMIKENISEIKIDKRISDISDEDWFDDCGGYNQRFLSDSDAECLIFLYESLMKRTNDEWNKIVDIFCELRECEIEDDAFDEVNFDASMAKETNEGGTLESPIKVLENALQIFRGEKEDKISAKSPHPNSREMYEIIKSLKPNKS